MGFHPVNLAIRFLLELFALVAMGVWGAQQGDGAARYVLALLIPFVAATLWGVFAVPGDRSRSGKAPVAVAGAVRLGVEAAFFIFAVFALHQSGHAQLAAVLGAAIAIHYAVSYDRIAWLLHA
jgi:hypothetical protein